MKQEGNKMVSLWQNCRKGLDKMISKLVDLYYNLLYSLSKLGQNKGTINIGGITIEYRFPIFIVRGRTMFMLLKNLTDITETHDGKVLDRYGRKILAYKAGMTTLGNDDYIEILNVYECTSPNASFSKKMKEEREREPSTKKKAGWSKIDLNKVDWSVLEESVLDQEAQAIGTISNISTSSSSIVVDRSAVSYGAIQFDE